MGFLPRLFFNRHTSEEKQAEAQLIAWSRKHGLDDKGRYYLFGILMGKCFTAKMPATDAVVKLAWGNAPEVVGSSDDDEKESITLTRYVTDISGCSDEKCAWKKAWMENGLMFSLHVYKDRENKDDTDTRWYYHAHIYASGEPENHIDLELSDDFTMPNWRRSSRKHFAC